MPNGASFESFQREIARLDGLCGLTPEEIALVEGAAKS
jgi:hypothetical protein